jgi:hypothetical protein
MKSLKKFFLKKNLLPMLNALQVKELKRINEVANYYWFVLKECVKECDLSITLHHYYVVVS